MNAGNPFSFLFSPYVTGSGLSESLLFLTLFDFTTGTVVFDAGFKPATTTGLVLPANTLMPSHNYAYELIFSNRLLVDSPGAQFGAQIGYDLRTSGSFITAAVPEPSAIAFAGSMTAMAMGLAWRRKGRASAA